MSQSKHADEVEDWLFDSVVGYLSSPVFRNPIEHFCEQHCSIFSPDNSAAAADEGEENLVPAEHLEAHIKYKNLVDALINSFLQDLGVTYRQFLNACGRSKQLTGQPVYVELFETIWATENFNVFRSQMVKKNVELELQALILLQFQLGVNRRGKEVKVAEEDEIMAMVIMRSKDEYEERARLGKAEQETAQRISEESEEIEKSLQYEIDQQAYLARRAVKKEMKNEAGIATDRPVSAARRPESARKGRIITWSR